MLFLSSLEICDSTSVSHFDAHPHKPVLIHDYLALPSFVSGWKSALLFLPKHSNYTKIILRACLFPSNVSALRMRTIFCQTIIVCLTMAAQILLSGIAWDTRFQKVSQSHVLLQEHTCYLHICLLPDLWLINKL